MQTMSEQSLPIKPWPRIAWGVSILAVLAAYATATGTPLAGAFIVIGLGAAIIAWRFPYTVFNIWLSTCLLLGIQIAVSTGQIRIGERVFVGYLELTLGEFVGIAILVAWALRILVLWRGRRDRNWKPDLPLILGFGLMFAAQLASLASPVEPPAGEVVKHAFRYVAFTYLTCIALVVNFIRSRKRLRVALVILTVFGIVFALDGLRSVVGFDGGLSLNRAVPLPILETIPLGGNQHALAEVMLIGMCAALAFGALSKFPDQKLLASVSAAFMAGVAILTFSRTAWIALIVMAGILSLTVWKDWLLARKQWLAIAALFFIPLAAAMGVYTLSSTAQGSIDSRSMLTSIAVDAFTTSPVFGIGAGTFYDRVSRTYAFVVEFGPAFDAHGFLQKTLAETGVVGLFALMVTMAMIAREMWKVWTGLSRGRIEREAYAYLAVGVIGSFIYQLFSTSYWTPRLWLPVGIMLAAGRIFLEKESERDPDFLRKTHG